MRSPEPSPQLSCSEPLTAAGRQTFALSEELEEIEERLTEGSPPGSEQPS